MRLLVRAVEGLASLLAWLSMAGVFTMMVLIVVDVVLRTFFRSSLLFVDEVCGYLLVAVAFFAYAEALKRDVHVRVDMLFQMLPRRLQARFDLVFAAVSVAAVGTVGWASVVMVSRAYERNVIVPGVLLTPVWIPQIAVIIGLAALLLQFLVEVRKLATAAGEGAAP
jgi:TRAP-type C4-dicarboxylate transport system permease small subunit